MIDPHTAGQADWARLYLLLTAVEEAVEDAGSVPTTALPELHREYASVLDPGRSGPAVPEDQLLRQELRYGRRLLDALYAGRPLDRHVLGRSQRPCATLGCGNDALVRYCLSCGARRAKLAAGDG